MKHLSDKNKNLINYINQFTITVCGKVGYKNDDLGVEALVKEKMIHKADLKQCYDYGLFFVFMANKMYSE